MQNPYTILGLDEGDDDKTLRVRYRKVTKMVHPDKHENDKSAVVLFQIVRQAYDTIKTSKNKIVLPGIIHKREAAEVEEKAAPVPQSIVPGTNITENDIRILGEQLKDPWFHPNFGLSELFGDVTIPEKEQTSKQVMRPSSTRR